MHADVCFCSPPCRWGFNCDEYTGAGYWMLMLKPPVFWLSEAWYCLEYWVLGKILLRYKTQSNHCQSTTEARQDALRPQPCLWSYCYYCHCPSAGIGKIYCNKTQDTRLASRRVRSVWKSLGRVSFGSKKFGPKIFLMVFSLNWIILSKNFLLLFFPPFFLSWQNGNLKVWRTDLSTDWHACLKMKFLSGSGNLTRQMLPCCLFWQNIFRGILLFYLTSHLFDYLGELVDLFK